MNRCQFAIVHVICDQLHETRIVGAGVLHKLRRRFICVLFWLSSSREMESSHRFLVQFLCCFWCADFGAQIFAQLLYADYVSRFLHRLSVRNAQIFLQILHRFSTGVLALKIGVPESSKKCAQNLLSWEGSLLHLCCLEKKASHTIATRRKQSRRGYERPS